MNGRSWWPSVLQLYDYWDSRLEPRRGLLYSSVLLGVYYVGSGLCNELNTCSRKSCWVFVRLIACDLETSKRDGLSPSCAFNATEQEWRACQTCSISKVLILGQWKYLLTHPVIFQRCANDSGTFSNLHTSPVLSNVSLSYQYSNQGCTSRFSGAFTTLRQGTISFIMSICPSVCMEQLFSLWKDFNEVWYLSFFRTSDEKIQVSLEPSELCIKPMYIFIISRSVRLRMRNVSENIVEKVKTRISYIITRFRKSSHIGHNVEKHCRARQATHDNTTHAHCMLDT